MADADECSANRNVCSSEDGSLKSFTAITSDIKQHDNNNKFKVFQYYGNILVRLQRRLPSQKRTMCRYV